MSNNPTNNPTNNSNNPDIDKFNNFMGGGKPSIFTPLINGFGYINHNVMYLNNSKFFAGVVMILLNIGSKFITIQYMKWSISKQILVFAMAWMGTRDIYAALGLTAVFTILSEYLFNEESKLCIVPQKYRVLEKLIDTNNDGDVTDVELSAAVAILEKAKRDKQRKAQKNAMLQFDFQKFDYDQ